MIPFLFALALAQVEDIPRPPAAQSKLVLEAYGQMTLSTGLGEDTVSPAVGVRVGHQALYLTAFYERSRKLETGDGYIAGLELETRRGHVLTGFSAHRRSGGAWVKYPLQVSVGFEKDGIAGIFTQETATLGDDGPGSEQTRSLTVRYRHKAYEQRASIYNWRTHRGSGVGATFQIILRVGKRAK